jgi:hypothetical protein
VCVTVAYVRLTNRVIDFSQPMLRFLVLRSMGKICLFLCIFCFTVLVYDIKYWILFSQSAGEAIPRFLCRTSVTAHHNQAAA